MVDVIYLFSGIMFFIAVVILIFFLYNKYQEGKKPENQTILEHYMPQYSNGHTDGIVQSIEIGEKRIKIVLLPRDINYIRELNKNKFFKIKPYVLFFDKKQVDPFPEGSLSMHRNKLKAYPNDISLLPEPFKHTRFGKAVMGIINTNNELKDESELMQQRMLRLKNVSKNTYGGEIFTDFAEITKQIIKDKNDLTKKEDKMFIPGK